MCDKTDINKAIDIIIADLRAQDRLLVAEAMLISGTLTEEERIEHFGIHDSEDHQYFMKKLDEAFFYPRNI